MVVVFAQLRSDAGAQIAAETSHVCYQRANSQHAVPINYAKQQGLLATAVEAHWVDQLT